MKTLTLILITLSFTLFGINAAAAELDENLKKRCDSLPFSLEGTPLTGKFGSGDPDIEYKGELIDGITHIFYPSGKLQRRGKRINDDGSPNLKGERSIGIFEVFDEECYLVSTATRNNNGVLLSGEFFDKGSLIAKGNYTNDQQDGIWEYYKNGTLIEKRNWKLGLVQLHEFFTNGTLVNRKDFYESGINNITEIYTDGILSLRGPWKDNEQHGEWKSYDKSGTVTNISHFEKGKILTDEYFKNEVITQRNHLKNGITVSVEIFENGNLKYNAEGPGWDENGKQTGIWEYYENGTLVSKNTWKDGKHIKAVMIYPSITCAKLVKDFGANEMRALRDHKNKTYIVSARVSSVGADFMDNPQITLSDGDQWSFNSCIASPAKDEEFYYDLNEGQLVKMQCTIKGEVMGSPVLEKCVLAN